MATKPVLRAVRGKQTLESWVNEAMTDMDKDKPCSAMSLVHMVGESEKEIHTVTFGDKQWEPKELAEMFRHKAEGYGQDIPGVQQFGILAFYGSNEPQARHPFTITGALEFNGLATEGPHAQGLTQQAMRHAEAMVQLSFRQTAMLFEMSNAMNMMLSNQNQKLMEENHAALEMAKALMVEQAQQAHLLKIAELKEQKKNQLINRVMGMIPSLTNSFLGTEVFTEPKEDSSHIEALASLDENALRTIAATLPPHIWAPLAKRLAGIIANQVEAQKSAETALAKVDPEKDAGGES